MIVVSDTSPLTALMALEEEAGMYLTEDVRDEALKSVAE